MKISVEYGALVAALASMSIVVEDSLNSEDLKSVIVMVSKDDKKVKLVGVNQLIVYRTFLPEDSYTVEAADEEFNKDGIFFMQVKSKELTGYLSAFKSVRRTKIEGVTMEIESGKVKMTVTEANIDTGDEYKSSWRFDSLPIKQTILNSISVEIPENVESVETLPLALYTSCILPILQNTNSINGMLQFGKDDVDEEGNTIEGTGRVAAFTPTFNTLLKNALPSQFRGISFYYRAVAFMKSVICAIPVVSIARTDQYMCFRDEGNFEAFVRYTTKLADYSPYLKMFTRQHAVVLDRQYLKDVLKRLSLVDEQVTVTIEDGSLTVSNSKFVQDLPILKEKAMEEMGKVTFRIKPDVLEKAVIGDDSQFSELLFLYIDKQESGGWTLIFSDDTGAWFSVARIR